MKIAFISVASMVAFGIGAAAAGQRIDVPIVVGGNDEFDACNSSGQVVGLDPHGDGFLSVQSGPGGRPFKELDRIHNGQMVYICAEQGKWLGVVYGNGRNIDCNVSNSWSVRQPYTGPCRYGWVHQRYVRLIAG